MKIMIDAGHGPDTPGKRVPDDSMREYEFNSSTARRVVAALNDYKDVQVEITFEDTRDVPLKERTNKANAWEADLFVSIHANAVGDYWNDNVGGIETYVYLYPGTVAPKLAAIIQSKLIAYTGLRDRGVKQEDFHVLRETVMPAILCECGFISNHYEADLLKADSYRRKCADAIVDGIAEFYGLSKDSPDLVPGNGNQTIDKGWWRKAMNLTIEQWRELAAELNRMYQDSVSGKIIPPVLNDYRWVEKAYKTEMTPEELLTVMSIIQMRRIF